MQYSILIYGADGAFDSLSQEQQDEIMKGHHELQAALRKKGDFATAKLMPTSNAVTLRPTAEPGQKPLVIDGPFAETKEQLGGFYLIEAADLDAAIAWAAKLPSSKYGSIEVRPIWEADADQTTPPQG